MACVWRSNMCSNTCMHFRIGLYLKAFHGLDQFHTVTAKHLNCCKIFAGKLGSPLRASTLSVNLPIISITHPSRNFFIPLSLSLSLCLFLSFSHSLSRRGCMHAICFLCSIAKLSNLELKTQPEQLQGSLLIAFTLPSTAK